MEFGGGTIYFVRAGLAGNGELRGSGECAAGCAGRTGGGRNAGCWDPERGGGEGDQRECIDLDAGCRDGPDGERDGHDANGAGGAGAEGFTCGTGDSRGG